METELVRASSPCPNDQICIPESPKKIDEKSNEGSDTPRLLPEFQILLRSKLLVYDLL